MAELRKLSTHCEFGDHLNEALRDRLVCGMRDTDTQRKLLTMASLTLTKALEVAQGAEAAQINSKALKGEDTQSVRSATGVVTLLMIRTLMRSVRSATGVVTILMTRMTVGVVNRTASTVGSVVTRRPYVGQRRGRSHALQRIDFGNPTTQHIEAIQGTEYFRRITNRSPTPLTPEKQMRRRILSTSLCTVWERQPLLQLRYQC